MSDRKRTIPDLPVVNTFSGDELLWIVDDPSGTPVDSRATIANILGNTNAAMVANTLRVSDSRTPANSTINCVAGQIFWDASYLYIAIANNTLKRVALSSF